MSGPQAIGRPTIAFVLQCCNSSSISNSSIEISPPEFAKTDKSLNSVKTKYNFINLNIFCVGSYTKFCECYVELFAHFGIFVIQIILMPHQ